MDKKLLDILACPECHRPVQPEGDELVCVGCGLRYPVRDGLSPGTKGAIEQLVRGLAAEEGRFGIRANCVGPGMMTFASLNHLTVPVAIRLHTSWKYGWRPAHRSDPGPHLDMAMRYP